MIDALLAFPGAALAHWPAFALAAYLGVGFHIGLREALETRRALRRQEVADSLWPTLALLTCLWPMIFAQRGVEYLILAWLMFGTAREERKEKLAGSRSPGLRPGTGMTGKGDHV